MDDDTPVWAIAKVTDSTPANLEYGDYRGYVLLRDDLFVAEAATPDDGVAAFAERQGVAPQDVRREAFTHDQYDWYRVLSVS